MKKILGLLITAALAFSLFTFGAAADSDAVKIGTPIVDGKLDEIYKDSFSLALGEGKNDHTNAASVNWDYTATGRVYFLYDDTHLYVCATVNDDDVLTKGEEFAKGTNPYQNDNVECRLCLDGETTVKVGVDAYGYACYGNVADYDMIDYNEIKYAATHTDTSYIIEFAVPCTKGRLDMKSSGKMGFKYQFNDLNADGETYFFARDYAGEGPKGIVFYDLSTEKAVAPSAGTTTATGAVTAPSTFDPAIIAVALTAASGAAFVLASKKR